MSTMTLRATVGLALALAVVVAAPMQAQSTFKLLHGFLGGSDGAHPTSGVAFGPNGYLYGVTLDGGAYKQGTVFSISPGGRYKQLYAFTGGADGGFPADQLTWVGTSLYGVTNFGGDYNAGVIFMIDSSSGAETTLYSFTGSTDGYIPDSTMIADASGNLYGTAFEGGANSAGTIFRFVPATGILTTLYAFQGQSDGKYPSGRLARDMYGNLYGATLEGGTSDFGTIFRLSASGVETVLYSFLGYPVHDVYYPYANVTKDSAGNLYGGGTSGGAGDGAVFKVSRTGAETIYNVPSGTSGPSSVVMDSDGNFYGTMNVVGYYGGVFKMDASGTYTILYSFTGGLDGTSPNGADVIRDAKGNLYGTTYSGGVGRKYGTVFELTLP